ncbi:hypothetical protein MRX96_046544 [Rhipicephalus microplus]
MVLARVYSSFSCLALRLLHAWPGRHCLLTTSSGSGHRRDRNAVVACRQAHLVLPGPAAARRSRCHGSRPPEFREESSSWVAPRSCPFWLPGTTPSSATSARDLDSPAAGPSLLASTVSPSSGPAGLQAPASSRPAIPVQPRQPILDGDVLWVYLPAPVELQCPVSDWSIKYSGANWTSRVQSVRRHVEFEDLVRVNNRIHVCSVCDSRLTSRPSYHRCLATATLAPSLEAPWCRCGVCDATLTRLGLLALLVLCPRFAGTKAATLTRLGLLALLVLCPRVGDIDFIASVDDCRNASDGRRDIYP